MPSTGTKWKVTIPAKQHDYKAKWFLETHLVELNQVSTLKAGK